MVKKIFRFAENIFEPPKFAALHFLNFDNLAGSIFRPPAPPSDAKKVNLQIWYNGILDMKKNKKVKTNIIRIDTRFEEQVANNLKKFAKLNNQTVNKFISNLVEKFFKFTG